MRSWIQQVGRIPAGWWLGLLILPALAPLARPGFFDSLDGPLHIYRLAALDGAVRSGVLYPRWFSEFGFGYGQPVLNFYGPLSYYWGLPFTLLGASPVLAIKLVLASGLIASAWGMYLFARLHLGRIASLVGAVVYTYLPYHLVDLYYRGAVAEFLAFVWFPLVLWAFQRLIENRDQRGGIQPGLAALLFAALILTHSLSAFLFAPVLVVYIVILLFRTRDRRALARSALALAGALVLTSFYWMPVLAESQYVGLGHGTSPGYRDHLLPLSRLISWAPGYPYPARQSEGVAYPLGWVQALVMAGAVVWVFRRQGRRGSGLFFLALALLSALMLTTASVPLWQALERVLAFLQYPWRFQALTVLASAFLAGMLVEGLDGGPPGKTSRYRAWAAAGLVIATGLWALWPLSVTSSPADFSVEAMWQQDRATGQIGATWTGEYLPVWVKEQRWAISLPEDDPGAAGESVPAGALRLEGVGANRYDWSLQAAEPTHLVLHQFYFPGWKSQTQGAVVPARPEGALGLAAFDLAPGTDALVVRLGLTRAQQWGTLISLAAFLIAGVALVSQYQLEKDRFTPSPVKSLALAACYLLPAAGLLAHLVLPNGYVHQVNPVNANLENTVELLSFATDRPVYRPGDTAEITLYWRALRTMDQDYKAFVHLTDAGLTEQVAQNDGDPGGGFSPTTRWLAGEVVPDIHSLSLPGGLSPGRYRLWAGMYEHETVRNLTIVSAGSPVIDHRVLLGEIEVVAP